MQDPVIAPCDEKDTFHLAGKNLRTLKTIYEAAGIQNIPFGNHDNLNLEGLKTSFETLLGLAVSQPLTSQETAFSPGVATKAQQARDYLEWYCYE